MYEKAIEEGKKVGKGKIKKTLQERLVLPFRAAHEKNKDENAGHHVVRRAGNGRYVIARNGRYKKHTTKEQNLDDNKCTFDCTLLTGSRKLRN